MSNEEPLWWDNWNMDNLTVEKLKALNERMSPEDWRREYEQEFPIPGYDDPSAYDRCSRERLVEALIASQTALRNVEGYLDTPVARRKADGDWMYQPVINSVRNALQTIRGVHRR